MKRILIAGVAGFIGTNLAEYLSKSGMDVFGIDMIPEFSNSALKEYKCVKLPQNITQILDNWKISHVINCAGNANVGKSILEPGMDFHSSVTVTYELLDSIRKSENKIKFILISSAAVYGNPSSLPIRESDGCNPISPYGYHKLLAEQICKEFFEVYNISSIILRIFSAYGKGLKKQLLWDITNKIVKEDELILWGTGEESRDFINIKDICRAIECVISKSVSDYDILNVASGKETKIREIAEYFMRCTDKPLNVIFNNYTKNGDPLNWRADISKLRKLGFEPEINIEEEICAYFSWAKGEIERNGQA